MSATTSGTGGLALSSSKKLRTTLLCLLYFAQGFPWGFTTVALLAAFSEAGHSREMTATITALAYIPWTFKFFWAPMIDTFRMPALGLRRPWIAIAQFGMSVTLLCMILTGVGEGSLEQESTLKLVAWAFFVHNCFASLQDVATDALAVDLLQDDERGRVNGMMWASKLVGIGVGGAGFGKVIAIAGLTTAILTQTLLVLAILGIVILVRERAGEKLTPWSPGSVQASAAASASLGFATVLRELLRSLATKTTALACVMALIVNLCEGLYIPLTTQLFVQDFGWGAERYSEVTGTLGVGGELIGALLGGFLCDRMGLKKTAAMGMILTSVVLLTFGATSGMWPNEGYPRAMLIPMFKGSFAFTTVCLFSLYMKISWTGAAACQFTLYMALNNFSHTTGAKLNSLNSWLANWTEGVQLSDGQHYLLGGGLVLLPLIFLALLRPDSIQARKDAEAGSADVTPGPAVEPN